MYHGAISLALAIGNSTVLYFLMARTDPQTNIRLPLGLKERLSAAARANTRTMNAEVVSRLERSFVDAQAGVVPEDAIKAILETREMVSELHQAIKSPPPSPNPFAKKKA
jgi:predicted DNA-binding protein